MQQYFFAALNEIQERIDLFKADALVDESRIGIVGQCLTGGFILHAAIREEVKAPVVFHHSFGLIGSGIPSACSAKIKNKVRGHFVTIEPLNKKGKNFCWYLYLTHYLQVSPKPIQIQLLIIRIALTKLEMRLEMIVLTIYNVRFFFRL